MLNDSNRPIAVDLFCGVGGFSLGFEQAGFDVLAAVEINPIHCATYKYNFSFTSVICRDVTTITGAEIRNLSSIGDKEIDVVFGGSPCQGFSIMGKRNLEDKRNSLIFQFLRLVVELQPKYFVLENVKGITLGKCEKILLEIINNFKSSDYSVQENYQILNAANYGVPQNRERLFLLGCRNGGVELPNYPTPILENGTSTATPTVWDAIADLPEVENYPELLEQDCVVGDYGKLSKYAATLRGFLQLENDYSYTRLSDPRLLTCSLRTRHSSETIERFKDTLPGQKEPVSRFLKLDPNGICNTLRAGTDRSRGSHTAARPIHPFTPRVLTTREAARLHSYPDWVRFHVTKLHGFRQVGNSVPPLLGKIVASEIIKVLGVTPSRPETFLELGDEKLLNFTMTEAANYFGIDRFTYKTAQPF